MNLLICIGVDLTHKSNVFFQIFFYKNNAFAMPVINRISKALILLSSLLNPLLFDQFVNGDFPLCGLHYNNIITGRKY